MALEEAIVEWAQGCPVWHRHVLRRLASGESLGPEDYTKLAEQLAIGDQFDDSDFSLGDMPGGTTRDPSIRLVNIREVSNVNALLPDQTLTFGLDGMTVVYGDNASGKSGFARLAKRAVRARHHEDILTNVFTERAGNAPAAELTIDIDGQQHLAQWPDDPRPELRQISFFDSACSSAYISADSEIAYRPSALFLLDGLILACDGVRAELEGRLSRNAADAHRLPELEPGTAAAQFVQGLSALTTLELGHEACRLPDDADEQIVQLQDEEARLRATDPEKERSRLKSLAGKYQRLVIHATALADKLSESSAADLNAKSERLRGSYRALQIASTRSFEADPLSGVASHTWRLLWEAARAFSESECYAGRHFPVTDDGARCVLCQQELDADASDRLHRLDAFVEDRTQQAADAARRALESATTALEALQTSPSDIDVTLADLEAEDADLIEGYRDSLEQASARRECLLASSTGTEWVVPGVPPPSFLTDRLQAVAKDLTDRALRIEASTFSEQLSSTVTRRVELEARRKLASAQTDVLHEIERLNRRGSLVAAQKLTDTSRITRKSTELTRSHVTALVRDRFTRESDRLRLERVTLEDQGGQKGQLRHRPTFVGAMQRASLQQVLSEGEQTALGLAGFFTEVHFDESRSAIILDDPVSSLDHVRREYVARRLTELSTDRQVIVFTHDVSFVTDLRRAADAAGVTFTERSVARRGNQPGVCHDGHPWKAKDVQARLADLEHRLAAIKKAAPGMDSEAYENEVAEWSGRLSETWERAVNLEVVGKVVDRTTLEVRPKMFRILAKITVDDDKQFQESYGRCSKWARRHDKSPEVNYVAPTTAEMENELDLVRSWFDRIRKYGQ
jgi:energy-coupling factor transporter ATP-binding protein EcfA2